MKILFLSLLISFNLFAKVYVVNSAHSSISFTAPYMGLMEVDGTFRHFLGSFDYDLESKKIKDLYFVVDIKSVDTVDGKRDKHLKQKDFFFVQKYPKGEFKGNEFSYDKKGNPTKVTGLMTLRGVTKKVSFNIHFKGQMKDPWDQKKRTLFLTADTTVNRKDFGISWNKKLDQGGYVVGDHIKVAIKVEANPSDSRPAFSRFLKRRTHPPKKQRHKSSILGI